jgi:tripartite-type tricarboxylate transporter receptor subunit TctC
MPPGTPKEMVGIIRRAFDATLKDPAFRTEADRARLEIDPVDGEAMTQLIRQAYATPKAAINRAAELMKN